MYVSQVMDLIVAKGIGGGDEDGEDGPAEHRCPITLQLMVDPTSLYDSDCLENPNLGHTFEGRVIEHHLSLGKRVCPVSKSCLSKPLLVPNCMLKRSIAKWPYSQEARYIFSWTS